MRYVPPKSGLTLLSYPRRRPSNKSDIFLWSFIWVSFAETPCADTTRNITKTHPVPVLHMLDEDVTWNRLLLYILNILKCVYIWIFIQLQEFECHNNKFWFQNNKYLPVSVWKFEIYIRRDLHYTKMQNRKNGI